MPQIGKDNKKLFVQMFANQTNKKKVIDFIYIKQMRLRYKIVLF